MCIRDRTFLGLNDKYKFTTQVSEKAIEPPPGIKKAAEVGQELSASHELKPIAQETQKYVGFVAPNLWIKAVSYTHRGMATPAVLAPRVPTSS